MSVVDIALKSGVISWLRVMTQSALVGGCFFLGKFGVPLVT
jgi:hypothetical protein